MASIFSRVRLSQLLVVGLVSATFSAAAGVYEDILVAAENNDTSKVVELLRRGMDVNTSDRDGNTLTQIAARNGNNELLDFLLANRANPLKHNRYGDSPLMAATMQGHVETVRHLLAAGADVHNRGWNALHYAAYSGQTQIARMLVEHKADLDARAPNGQTALMLAANVGYLDIVRLLVDADADMDLEDSSGYTALGLAESKGHDDVADYLRSEGAVE